MSEDCCWAPEADFTDLEPCAEFCIPRPAPPPTEVVVVSGGPGEDASWVAIH